MKNRVLGMMAAAAALGMSSGALNAPAQAGFNPTMPKAQGGMTAPQGGIGTMLQAMLGTGGHGGGPSKPNYRRGGYTVAQGKRAARKRRNVLRARGQYRQAVR